MPNKSLILVFILFALLGWAGDIKADRAAIMKAERDFEAARANKGLEGWLSFFAEDATSLDAGQPIVEGKSAMRERLQKRFNPNLLLKWQPVKVEVAASGDMAWSAGTWQLCDKSKPEGDAMATGKYLTVWRKQEDGSWKVVADTGNEDPTPQKK